MVRDSWAAVARKGVDLVMIDTGPASDTAALAAARLADLINPDPMPAVRA
jgi:hypothetical protein